jgi:hypothetical protein
MPRLVPELHPDVDVYLVVNDFDRFGVAYVETDTAEADRETIIRNLLGGQYSKPVRVIALNPVEGWSRDVSDEIARELLSTGDHRRRPVRSQKHSSIATVPRSPDGPHRRTDYPDDPWQHAQSWRALAAGHVPGLPPRGCCER